MSLVYNQSMSRFRSPLVWFVVTLLATAGLAALGPPEKFLGSAVRIIYLHGSWVLTAEAALGLSAACGIAAILFRRTTLQRWSGALGYTGLFFWVTYLPLSLWAMQANWNGLFLAEPRFRIAVIFSVTGILLQIGLALVGRPFFTSLFNVFFFAALVIALSQAGYVMHPPPSPIFTSGNPFLELYFILVILLNMSAAYFLTRTWLQKQP